jgi:GNAT superfamily N-acetyltransferase
MTTVSTAPSGVLRPAAVGDVATISGLWHVGWQEAHEGHVPDELARQRTLAALRRRVAEDLAAIQVVSGDGGLAGFVTVRDDEVEQLYVAPAARGTGVAGRLLDHAEAVVAERHDRAWLAVVAANGRARDFYARRGWGDVGPFDYEARTASGTLTVAVRRYEKQVRP